MATVEPYTLVIPSKQRPKNMPRMLHFFPYAHVWVDEAERADYAPFVPEGQLFCHPGLPSLWHIWRHMIFSEPTDVVVTVDDDLQFIASQTTAPRCPKITDPEDIRRIVENGVNAACDLDISLYGWSLMSHPGGFNPLTPMTLTGVLMSAIVMRGLKSGRLTVDVDTNYCDLDLTMQALLKDRVLIKDMRFYWCFGATGEGEGGESSNRTMESFRAAQAAMVKKWGRWLNFGNKPIAARMVSGTGRVEHLGHKVSRKSHIARK